MSNFSKVIFALTLGWLGLAFCLLLVWNELEWHFAEPKPPSWLALISLLFGYLVYHWRSRIKKFYRRVCYVALLITFLLYFPWEIAGPQISDNHPPTLTSSLNTKDGHFFLTYQFVYAEGIDYKLKLYRCNTLGFDCKLMRDVVVKGQHCDLFGPKDYLKLGADQQVKIVHSRTGLIYPDTDIHPALASVNCADSTIYP